MIKIEYFPLPLPGMDLAAHWNAIYRKLASEEASWFQRMPTKSIELLREYGARTDDAIIDVGGGDSRLVDALLDQGFDRLTVLDVSLAALSRARKRLGSRSDSVRWLEADITSANLGHEAYAFWHDRAVFHFLIDAAQRRRYVATAANALRPDSTLIVATFAPDGPTESHGLEVRRYTPELLASEFGQAFSYVHGLSDTHRTPQGDHQSFSFAVLRRRRLQGRG
ncbi:MAG: class I SAM-dependent methyltransferase [Gemmatimonadaceae bacterium]